MKTKLLATILSIFILLFISNSSIFAQNKETKTTNEKTKQVKQTEQTMHKEAAGVNMKGETSAKSTTTKNEKTNMKNVKDKDVNKTKTEAEHHQMPTKKNESTQKSEMTKTKEVKK